MWYVNYSIYTYFVSYYHIYLILTLAEADLPQHRIPVLLPVQHGGVPDQPCQLPDGGQPSGHYIPGLADCLGRHAHNLDCQKPSHVGENKKYHNVLREGFKKKRKKRGNFP